MLQRKQPVIRQQRRIGVAKNGEYAALVTRDMGTVQLGRPDAALERVSVRNGWAESILEYSRFPYFPYKHCAR